MPILGLGKWWLNIKFGGPPGINEVVVTGILCSENHDSYPQILGCPENFRYQFWDWNILELCDQLWIFTSKQLVYPDIRQEKYIM